MPSHTPRHHLPSCRLEAGRRAFTRLVTLAGVLCALLFAGSAFGVTGAVANSYTGLLASSAGAGAAPPSSGVSSGYVLSSQSWTPPNGMQFAGFAYTGAAFFSVTNTGVGGVSAGFVGTGGNAPATLMFPWTQDCSITNSGHDWANGSGVAGNDDECDTAGSTGGWNYDNSERESPNPAYNPQTSYSTLTLEAFCQASSCPTGDVYEDRVTNLSGDINDPNNQPTGSGSWTNVADGNDWYQSDNSGPALNVSASDPAGVCAIGVQWNGPGDYYTQVTDDNPGMENVGGAIGNEFDSIQPCGTGSANGSATMPAAITSGTYSVAVVASNPGNWEGGDGLSNAPTIASYSNAINIDDTTPSATWAGAPGGWTSSTAETLDVTVGPSGVSSVTCTDNGSNVAATLISGSTSGAGTTAWSVPTATNGVNAVSCSVANGDTNGALTGSQSGTFDVDTTVPVMSFADSGYTAGTWTNASQTITVSATGGPSGIQGVACSLDGNSAPLTGPDSDQVTISGDGEHVLDCTATSNTNVPGEATYDVWVDTRQPTVSFSGAEAAPVWLAGTPTVLVTGGENGGTLSGVTQLICSVNGGSPITMNVDAVQGYTSSFVLTPNGADVVSCRATDAAGTTSSAYSETVNVDNPSGSAGGGNLTQYGSSPDIDNGADPFSNGPSQTTWYHTPQSVTVTALNTAGGAAITQIACTGASQTTSGGTYPVNSQNAYGNGGEQVTVTVQPPGGDLSCSAQDSAGNTYPLGAYEFEIDNQAPTGYFEPQASWPQPDEVQLYVTDGTQGSGTATVQVTAQDGSGPIYKVIATRDGSQKDVWDAYFDDSTIPPGTYTFVAYPTDVAGNSGSITTNQSGSTEDLGLPLRDLTSLTSELSAGSATAPGATDGVIPSVLPGGATSSSSAQISSVRRARIASLASTKSKPTSAPKRCTGAASTVPSKAEVNSGAKMKAKCPAANTAGTTLTVAYGESATLAGVLKDTKHNDKPIAGAQITIYQQPTGTSTVTKLATVTTNSHGAYDYRVKGGPSRTLYAVYNGTTILRGVAAQAKEATTGSVTITVPKDIHPGARITIKGHLRGGFVSDQGAIVQLWYHIKGGLGGWAPFARAIHTNPKGAWKFTFLFATHSARVTFQFRAQVTTQTGWAYRGTQSKVAARTVI